MNMNTALGRHFRKKAKSRKLTQHNLRDKTGWSQQQISYLMLGKRAWTADRINCVAKLFGQRAYEFLAEADGVPVERLRKALN